MKPVEKVLDKLDGARGSKGSWRALCPAHEDREPSLSITEGDDGRALLKCFAACDTENVVAALGLEMKELFESRNGHKKELHSISPKTTATLQPCNPATSRTTPKLKACQSSSYRSKVYGIRSTRENRQYASLTGV